MTLPLSGTPIDTHSKRRFLHDAVLPDHDVQTSPSARRSGRVDGGIFFLHLMKTGGTSLHWLMRSWFTPEEMYPSPTSNALLWEKAFPSLLLDVRAAEPEPRRFYSVHMAAWVADEVAPDHLRITV